MKLIEESPQLVGSAWQGCPFEPIANRNEPQDGKHQQWGQLDVRTTGKNCKSQQQAQQPEHEKGQSRYLRVDPLNLSG